MATWGGVSRAGASTADSSTLLTAYHCSFRAAGGATSSDSLVVGASSTISCAGCELSGPRAVSGSLNLVDCYAGNLDSIADQWGASTDCSCRGARRER